MNLLNAHGSYFFNAAGQFFNFGTGDQKYLGTKSLHDYIKDIRFSMWMKKSGITWLSERNLIRMETILILEAMMRMAGNKIPGDKSTVQDHIKIWEVFPHSRIIVMMRDVRDVVVSYAYHFERGSKGRIVNRRLNDDFVEDVAIAWQTYNDHVLSLAKDNSNRLRIVKYEEMHASEKIVVTDVLKFLGSDVSAEIVRRMIETASFEKVSGGRKPADDDRPSSYRTGIAGDLVNYFR